MNIDERLQKLEAESFNNTQHRQLDTHITGQLFGALISMGVVDADDMRGYIERIGESIKGNANYDPDIVQTVDEHIVKWLGHIPNGKSKEFILMAEGKS